MRRRRWSRIALAAALVVSASHAALAGEVLSGLAAPSPALGRAIPFTLYRPADAPPAGERWPVLYLLHGLDGSERDWVEAGRAQETLDRLIGEGRIKPLLVVMPMAGNGWYVDNPDPSGEGRLASALTRDLIEHIDGIYPTAPAETAALSAGSRWAVTARSSTPWTIPTATPPRSA